MKTLTKSLLALAIVGFASGFLFVTGVIHAGNVVGCFTTFPLGAVFFGMFLICMMLEKEAALFHMAPTAQPANSRQSTENESPADYLAKPAH